MSDDRPAPPAPVPYLHPQQAPSPVLSILSLVFGIVGAVGGWFLLGILPAIAGVVLGFLARRREPQGRGLWIAGIVTGFVGIGGFALLILFYAVLIGFGLASSAAAHR